MLHDCLVWGIANARCQLHLLAEEDLSFNKAFKMAQAMELAERGVQQLHSQKAASSTPIQNLQDQPEVSKKASCLCYRRSGARDQAQCCFLKADCHTCGKKGHISNVCYSNTRMKSGATREPNPVHVAEEFAPR